jgi:ABC-type transport system involved in cytochrome bd biosynthesis fused ATPase/permease subunit
MSNPELDYRKIRRLAEERLQSNKFRKRITFLVASLFAFILFSVISWGLLLSGDGLSSQHNAYAAGLVLLTIGGMLSMLAQVMSLVMDTKSGERKMREQAYAQVLSEEMIRLGEDDEMPEKIKHMTRLTDDGELEEVPLDAVYGETDAQLRRRK